MKSSNTSNDYTKSLLEQTEELTQSLLIIRDSIELVIKNEQDHFLLPIYGQLRALIAEKSNNGLLLRLAEKYDIPLTVYRMKSIDEDINAPEIIREADTHFSVCPITIHKILPGQIDTTLNNIMQHYCIKHDGKNIELSTIIKYFAEKSGGAHFDEKIPDKDQIIENIVPNTGLIRDLCNVTIKLGAKIIQKISNLEYFLMLCIPQQDLNGKYILIDQKIPHSLQRMQIFLQSGVLNIAFSDFKGKSYILNTERMAPIDVPFILNYSIETLHNLTQRLVVRFNEEKIAEEILSRPLLYTNNPIEYDVFYNASHTTTERAGELHIGEMLGYGIIINDADRVKLFDYLITKNPRKFIKISNGAFGRSISGTNDVTFEGDVIHE